MTTRSIRAVVSATLAIVTQAGQWSDGLWIGEPPWLASLAPSAVQMMSVPRISSTTGAIFFTGA